MEIKPYSKNAKKHPKKQIEQVANSIKEFGMNQPIVVDKNGVIIVGHGRYEALKLLNWSNEEILKHVKVLDISEEKANAYRLADNKLNESEWDMGLVIEELKGLSDEMIDLTGFEKDLIIEPEEKDDDVPETPEEPKSKLGDLYELGRHRVLCGDSTKIEDVERLMDGKKADMVFTDPPYNVDFKSRTKNNNEYSRQGIMNDKISDDDFDLLINGSFKMLKNFSKEGSHQYICCNHRCYSVFESFFYTYFNKISTCIVWVKDTFGLGTAYRNKHEFIIFGGNADAYKFDSKNETNVWEFPSASSFSFRKTDNADKSIVMHPTMKPIALISKALGNSSKAGDFILDLFLGSGSTLIASEKTGRICYGMELDPKYVDVIVQRYVDYTGNKNIKLNGKNIVW